MSKHYAEVARASTIDYIGYCWKRLYPHGGTEWHYKEQPIEGEFHCGFTATRDGHGFIVSFRVPVEAGGTEIKTLCSNAADTLDNMILRIATK